MGRTLAIVEEKLNWNSFVDKCTGASHKENGVPCQDNVFKIFLNGVNVVALADGAGSARYSHFGSYIVVDTLSRLFADFFELYYYSDEEKLKKSVLFVALQALKELSTSNDHIEGLAKKLNIDPPAPNIDLSINDLSSTLLLVAVKDNRFITLHLGDGLIAAKVLYEETKEKVLPFSMPDNGEFSNTTFFTTSTTAIDHLRVNKGRIIDKNFIYKGFILMSDGPENSLYSKSKKIVAPACNRMIDACAYHYSKPYLEGISLFLKNNIANKTSDDCSIAILSCSNVFIGSNCVYKPLIRSFDKHIINEDIINELDLYSSNAHDYILNYLLENGWSYSASNDFSKQKSKLLTDYYNLPEPLRRLYRDTIKYIISFILTKNK